MPEQLQSVSVYAAQHNRLTKLYIWGHIIDRHSVGHCFGTLQDTPEADSLSSLSLTFHCPFSQVPTRKTYCSHTVAINISSDLSFAFAVQMAILLHDSHKKTDFHVPASKLFLLFCWNKVYTFIWLFLILHMLSLHWPATFLALAGESVTLCCDSRTLCTASWSVCEM